MVIRAFRLRTVTASNKPSITIPSDPPPDLPLRGLVTVTAVVEVLLSPVESVTDRLKRKIVSELTVGAVKEAMAAVALFSVTGSPAIWLHE